ncbi:MAG TPA: AAA family ATPase [Kofleriaceae bacterium]
MRTGVALSSDGARMVVGDGQRVYVAGGASLCADRGAIAFAVTDAASWVVMHDHDGHVLHRFDGTGTRVGVPTMLGELGDDVTMTVNRTGARMALLEGDRAVLVREPALGDGTPLVEYLGDCSRDRRVLVGGRGVAERSGDTIRSRTGSIPPLMVPSDLRGYAIGHAAAVRDGQALFVEMIGRDATRALVYDLRSGAVTKRIQLGDLRVLAVAERAGLIVLGRDNHLVVLDLRIGRCTSEHILACVPVACAIDAMGKRLVVIDCDGMVSDVDRSTPSAVEPKQHDDVSAEPTPLVHGSAPTTSSTIDENVPMVDAVTPPPAPAPLPLPPPPPLTLVHAPASAPVALRALGDAPDHASIPTGDALAAYLDDTRGWIEAMCTTTCLVARSSDDDALRAARARATAAGDAFAQWDGAGAPHVALAGELGLGTLATQILVIVAAPQIWGELARTYGECTNDRARPLVDELLLAHLLEANVAMRSEIARELDDGAPLIRSGAVTIARTLRPYAALAVHPVIARRLAGVVFDAPADEVEVTLADVIGPRAAIDALARALAEPRREPVRVMIRGRAGAGRRTLAGALAKQAKRPMAVIAAADPVVLHARLQHATLSGHLPCVDLDDLADDQSARARVRAILDEHVGPLFVIAPRDAEPPLAPGYDALEIPALTESERSAAWEAHGIARATATALASRFTVGVGPIARAARTGRDEAHLAAMLRSYRSTRIAAVAERIDERATWDELVVPEDIDEALRELVSRVRHRRTVLETWGMSRVATTARGVTALFQGGPGTGKTMASGVIASALGYELWRVDLSKIVSKWIGETEKNLAAVFDAAEEGEIVLLFDEADSLFAKRTEVKSSNDKHGNVATNYLLQRLDTFSGIAILTTNFGSAIDPAFMRRLSVHVQFPFPDEDDRERLWRAHLPASLPTSGDLELRSLAHRYQMSGGHIRNAILRAAYLAAERGGAITAQHLIRAVSLEKERSGKLGDGRIE